MEASSISGILLEKTQYEWKYMFMQEWDFSPGILALDDIAKLPLLTQLWIKGVWLSIYAVNMEEGVALRLHIRIHLFSSNHILEFYIYMLCQLILNHINSNKVKSYKFLLV